MTRVKKAWILGYPIEHPAKTDRTAHMSRLIRVFTGCTFKGIFSHVVVHTFVERFVCVEVLRPRQPNTVMSNAVSLPNHTFTGQA